MDEEIDRVNNPYNKRDLIAGFVLLIVGGEGKGEVMARPRVIKIIKGEPAVAPNFAAFRGTVQMIGPPARVCPSGQYWSGTECRSTNILIHPVCIGNKVHYVDGLATCTIGPIRNFPPITTRPVEVPGGFEEPGADSGWTAGIGDFLDTSVGGFTVKQIGLAVGAVLVLRWLIHKGGK